MIIWKELESKYEALLLHTVVRWLSRGKVLTRLAELRSEITTFLEGKRGSDMNLCLQGSGVISSVHDKIRGFIKKINL